MHFTQFLPGKDALTLYHMSAVASVAHDWPGSRTV